MKYFIRQRTLDSRLAVQIEFDKFNELKESQEILFAVQAIEEKYDLLIQNYLEFEQEILLELAKNMIFIKQEYDDFYEVKSVFNRRIVNFLTSARLYLDHISKHIRICTGKDKEEIKEILKSFTGKQYDTHLEYRFMEELRNYVQHYCLAVHSVENNSNRDQNNDQQVNGIKILACKKVLQQDKKLRKIMKDMDDNVELVQTTRIYMSSLSYIHNDIRSLIEERVNIARRTIEEAIGNYKKVNDGSTIGLHICSIASDDECSKTIDSYPILLGAVEH